MFLTSWRAAVMSVSASSLALSCVRPCVSLLTSPEMLPKMASEIWPALCWLVTLVLSVLSALSRLVIAVLPNVMTHCTSLQWVAAGVAGAASTVAGRATAAARTASAPSAAARRGVLWNILESFMGSQSLSIRLGSAGGMAHMQPILGWSLRHDVVVQAGVVGVGVVRGAVHALESALDLLVVAGEIGAAGVGAGVGVLL